jgi:hypothetical protein
LHLVFFLSFWITRESSLQNAFHSNDYLTWGSHLIFRRDRLLGLEDICLILLWPFILSSSLFILFQYKKFFLFDQRSRIEGGYEEWVSLSRSFKKGTQIEKAIKSKLWGQAVHSVGESLSWMSPRRDDLMMKPSVLEMKKKCLQDEMMTTRLLMIWVLSLDLSYWCWSLLSSKERLSL